MEEKFARHCITGVSASETIAAANVAANMSCTVDDYLRLSWIHPSYGDALNKAMSNDKSL